MAQNLLIPSDYNAVLNDIIQEVAKLPNDGHVAAYIPELARVNPDHFGMAVYCTDGQSFCIGESARAFSIQSMAKVLALTQACSIDPGTVWRRVGVEPSGTAFNSLVQLESENGIPRNPFINAGALVISDILVSKLANPKQDFLEFVRGLSGDETIEYDASVAASEFRTAARNRALTHFMHSFGNIKNDVETVLDFYVHKCALSMSCEQVAKTYGYLAADGLCPVGHSVLSIKQIRRINAIMLTCGFYDEAGEFAFRVGLPGKSGVGGGIVAVCPDRFVVAAWSPRLGEKGNSVRATEALRLFAQRTSSSVF